MEMLCQQIVFFVGKILSKLRDIHNKKVGKRLHGGSINKIGGDVRKDRIFRDTNCELGSRNEETKQR